MENFLTAVNAVLPTLFILFLGNLCRRTKVLNTTITNGFNKAIVYVFLPSLIAVNFLKVDLKELMDGELFLFAFLCLTGEMVLMFFLKKLWDKNPVKSLSVIVSVINSNCLILGGSIAVSLYGYLPYSVAFLASVISIVSNAYAILLFQLAGKGRFSFSLFLGIIKNPLIVTLLITLTIRILNVPLPKFLVMLIETLSEATTPVSLLCLGVFFDFNGLRKTATPVLKGIAVRYLFAFFVVWLAVQLGFRGERLAALIFVFGTSTAISAYPLSIEYGGDWEIVGNSVVISAITSIFFVALFIFVLKNLGCL
ncbi:MAG: AEC family transporter [Spirochaetaceae bacterium]|nr:AEC family transporter [Spirochaetaceae bacterium]